MNQAPSDTTAKRDLKSGLRSGDRRALAKAISRVEAGGPAAAEVLKGVQKDLGQALLVGVTGPPGAGKSTLVNAMITALRARGRTVGVIAVDPSSPVSGGAILGDRIRMSDHGADDGVFIRSLASGGATGGLSPATSRVADVLDGAEDGGIPGAD